MTFGKLGVKRFHRHTPFCDIKNPDIGYSANVCFFFYKLDCDNKILYKYYTTKTKKIQVYIETMG